MRHTARRTRDPTQENPPAQHTALVPYARLPREHHGHTVLTSTVDVLGTAHWLLTERPPQPGGELPPGELPPFDASVVSVHPDGTTSVTALAGVRARRPHLDRLPHGGFLVAASRTHRTTAGEQVQLFDAVGRETSSFSVGDAVEHLLVDGAGRIWFGHFDENPLGIRRWSTTGALVWSSDGADIPGLFDCYALNVTGTTAWACTYTDFPLVEIRGDGHDRRVRVWSNGVDGARAVAVHGERVAFYGGYTGHRDRLALGELTESTVERTDTGLLTLPDGLPPRRRRVVARGARIHVQAEPYTEWGVFDLGA
ncbi:hypothetical protein [Streptomyces sp. NPDC097619]|uniref:hypothetical protein n=1 Tax=Streptomyces sp. NPDC097619 TaxID=3157228 RepID=UPI00331FC6A3